MLLIFICFVSSKTNIMNDVRFSLQCTEKDKFKTETKILSNRLPGHSSHFFQHDRKDFRKIKSRGIWIAIVHPIDILFGNNRQYVIVMFAHSNGDESGYWNVFVIIIFFLLIFHDCWATCPHFSCVHNPIPHPIFNIRYHRPLLLIIIIISGSPAVTLYAYPSVIFIFHDIARKTRYLFLSPNWKSKDIRCDFTWDFVLTLQEFQTWENPCCIRAIFEREISHNNRVLLCSFGEPSFYFAYNSPIIFFNLWGFQNVMVHNYSYCPQHQSFENKDKKISKHIPF